MMFYLQRPIVVVSPTGEELTSNYIIRHYSDFSARVKPQLPLAFLRPGVVFIVRKNDAANGSLLESHGGRRVAEGAHFAAYTIP